MEPESEIYFELGSLQLPPQIHTLSVSWLHAGALKSDGHSATHALSLPGYVDLEEMV